MKRATLVFVFFTLLFASFGVVSVLGHGKSPRAQVSQMVGMTQITLDYGRPGVRGRAIWGELVPYDQPWRTGADKPTTLTVSTAVKIDGHELAAGTYGLLTVPGEDEWLFVLSTNSSMMGTRNYKPEEDALRVRAQPRQTARPREHLLFTFENLTEGSTDVVLRWEKLEVSFPVVSMAQHGGDSG